MTAVNPPGPPAYQSVATPLTNPTTGAAVVDPADLLVPSAPAPNPNLTTGGSAGGYISTPLQAMIAIYVELRVQNVLRADPASFNVDLQQLRAQEYLAAVGTAVTD
jgi:hypothetical protein